MVCLLAMTRATKNSTMSITSSTPNQIKVFTEHLITKSLSLSKTTLIFYYGMLTNLKDSLL
jgi:hypothetical protein